jgi:predicted secreted protein
MNKKTWFLIAMLLLAGLILAACAAPAAGESYKDKTATIVLEENPTTGYTWSVSVDNPLVIGLNSDKFYASGDKNVVGAGGVHQYVFKAAGPGDAIITFDLGQQWDGGEKGNKILKYKVTVDENGKIASLMAM